MERIPVHSEQSAAESIGQRFKGWFEKLFSGFTLDNIVKSMDLIDALKYGIFFAVLLLLLPLTAFLRIPHVPLLDGGVPFHNIAGGVYVDLGFGGILIASLVLTLTTWSLLYTQGLLIDGIESRSGYDVYQLESSDENVSRIHVTMFRFFNSEATWRQIVIYFLVVALSGTVTVIVNASEVWYWAVGAALLGIATGYFMIILLCLPAVLVAKEDPQKPLKLLPDGLSNLIWKKAKAAPWLGDLFRAGHRVISRRWWIFLQFIRSLFGKERREFEPINPKHFLAMVVVLALIIPVLIAWTTQIRFDSMPALVYAYILILFLIWTFTALDFHLARLRISSLAVLIVFIVATFWIGKDDHVFEVDVRNTPSQVLTPVDVVKGSRQKDKENLVVVVSAGGGIKATAWTTLALKELIEMRPELVDEIRLLSTVSGGTLGAAYYLNELCNTPIDSPIFKPDKDRAAVDGMINTVYEQSVSSSLSAVMYGFAFFDFWHLVSGGMLPPEAIVGDTDRGLLLENQWKHIGAAGVAKEPLRACQKGNILAFREDIRQGYLPAFIFNATVMESGRRVMITPLNFENSDGPFSELRGDTLTEILLKSETTTTDREVRYEADMDLWTAARLSAAFPYVTPAARAKIRDKEPLTDFELNQRWQQYHIIDGGYYDNFGVTSALDWLDPVLKARLNGEEGLKFKKVIIIQLRASPKPSRTCYKNDEGVVSAFVGPLMGLLNIRNGVALSRNEIELNRFVEAWNARFAGSVHISNVVIEPRLDIDPQTCAPPVLEAQAEIEIKTREDPLSWHLTSTQIEDLKEVWQDEKFIISSNHPRASQLKLEDIFE